MANERYAVYDGKDAAKVLVPAEQSAVVQVRRRQRLFPFFWVEMLGDLAVSRTAAALSFLRRYLFAGIVVFLKGARYLLRRVFASFRAGSRQFFSDARNIRRELRMLREGARRNENNRGAVLLRAYCTYLRRSLKQNGSFWKTLGNACLPLAALVLVLFCVGRMKTTTAALEVRLGDSVVGYAADENVVRRAMEDLETILPQNKAGLTELLGDTPTYQLSRVPLTALSGSTQLCETMLENAKAPLVHACGIFIDGTFLCAVRNESDAVAAFSALIEPVRANAKNGRTVAFVEEIDYVQGLYADDPDTLWDPIALKRALRAPKSEAQYYTVKSGDTLSKIKTACGVSAATLRALNPGADFEHLTAGQKLLVSPQTDYVRIKEMELLKYNSTVPFETIRRDSETLRAGTTRLVQTGKNGKQETTEMITYLGGKRIGSAIVSVRQLEAPVAQIIEVGTGSPYQGYGEAGGSNSSGFLWPTIGAYSVSSGFGYRNPRISGRSFHGGVDIVKPGGHSTGAPVIAAAAGRVAAVQKGYRGYGHMVLIDHGNGLQTRYAHMKPGSITVRAGQTVAQGQQLGQIGSTGNVTGPHLHFEVIKNGTRVNPMYYIG